ERGPGRRRPPPAPVGGANVCDPTGGSGGGGATRRRPRELHGLGEFNEGGAGLCREGGTPLTAPHRHFAGHGVSAPAERRWYWTGSLIEPGLVGASEIRRLWLAALAGPRPLAARAGGGGVADHAVGGHPNVPAPLRRHDRGRQGRP